MSQVDLQIPDVLFPQMLANLRAALQSLASLSSGDTEPATTYDGQLWLDTTNNQLKMRNIANNAWLTLATIDVANNRWQLHTDVLNLLSTAGLTIKSAGGATLMTLSNAGALDAVSIKQNGTALGGLALKNAADYTLLDVDWTDGTGAAIGMPTPAQMKAAIEALSTGTQLRAIIQDQKPDGTNGQTITAANTWLTHDLTTIVYDPVSLVTLSANQLIFARAGHVAFRATNRDDFYARLYNVTDAQEVVVTPNVSIGGGYRSQAGAAGAVLAGKTYELQILKNTTIAAGLSNITGVPEIYASLEYFAA